MRPEGWIWIRGRMAKNMVPPAAYQRSWHQQRHAAREFVRLFVEALFWSICGSVLQWLWRRARTAAPIIGHAAANGVAGIMKRHRKCGKPPLGIVKSWRMGQCGRAVILGPPYRLRWMERRIPPAERGDA
jgi:hypothetical protein